MKRCCKKKTPFEKKEIEDVSFLYLTHKGLLFRPGIPFVFRYCGLHNSFPLLSDSASYLYFRFPFLHLQVFRWQIQLHLCVPERNGQSSYFCIIDISLYNLRSFPFPNPYVRPIHSCYRKGIHRGFHHPSIWGSHKYYNFQKSECFLRFVDQELAGEERGWKNLQNSGRQGEKLPQFLLTSLWIVWTDLVKDQRHETKKKGKRRSKRVEEWN